MKKRWAVTDVARVLNVDPDAAPQIKPQPRMAPGGEYVCPPLAQGAIDRLEGSGENGSDYDYWTVEKLALKGGKGRTPLSLDQVTGAMLHVGRKYRAKRYDDDLVKDIERIYWKHVSEGRIPDPSEQDKASDVDDFDLEADIERQMARDLAWQYGEPDAITRPKKRARPKKAQVDSDSTQAGLDPLKPLPGNMFLSRDIPPAQYRIDEVWPEGGRILLAAQFKAGKTTMRNNLIRALADGTPFLEKFKVSQPSGRILVIDNEMDDRMSQRWLQDQGIEHPERFDIIHLRGNLAKFNILDEERREEIAEKFRGTDILIFDCLRPLMDVLGLDESREAGRVLAAFDELLKAAGIGEAVIIHHMGHSNERSRGDSRLRDWPDVEWKIVREKGTDGENDPRKPTYFSAYGRDVDVPEARLVFDHTTRHHRIEGGGRAEEKFEGVLGWIIGYLMLGHNKPQSGREIEAGRKAQKDEMVKLGTGAEGSVPSKEDVAKALKDNSGKDGRLIKEPGPRNGFTYAIRIENETGR